MVICILKISATQQIFPVACTNASLLSNCTPNMTEMLLCCSAFASLDQKPPVAWSHFHSSISHVSSTKELHNYSMWPWGPGSDSSFACICCFVLLARGWEIFKTRPPVAPWHHIFIFWKSVLANAWAVYDTTRGSMIVQPNPEVSTPSILLHTSTPT